MASDRLYPLSIETSSRWLAAELKSSGPVLSIPREAFAALPGESSFRMSHFGVDLETPLGVAAGPHSQMAQNIAAAYLVGASFFELKTVQILDEIKVAKPCIDMRDVGFNCEWSQELSLAQSADQYETAWVLCHIIARYLGRDPLGFSFNMSLGYDYRGIASDSMRRFVDSMRGKNNSVRRKALAACAIFKEYGIDADPDSIPEAIAGSVTLSTMHGCPREEIERIGLFLIDESALNTVIKLNPTLLGKELVTQLLNDGMGFGEITVPDSAFDHDPKLDEAVDIIESLRNCAKKAGVSVGIKLTNTLETVNPGGRLPAGEKQRYMSGRALHPICVSLAELIANRFSYSVPISISGGADAFNVAELLCSGLKPVTVCSDLLKPGGYGRMSQYLERIQARMTKLGAADLNDLAVFNALSDRRTHKKVRDRYQRLTADARGAAKIDELGEHLGRGAEHEKAQNKLAEFSSEHDFESLLRACKLAALESYAKTAREDDRYAKDQSPTSFRKVRLLRISDCMAAPCREGCPIDQDIPEYLSSAARGDFEGALAVIEKDNPLPSITGSVCHHPCESACVRGFYDEPLAVREVKHSAAGSRRPHACAPRESKHSVSVGIVGAGPAGLAAAVFCARAGHQVTVYEARGESGGIASSTIPDFRLSREALKRDIERVESQGVRFELNTALGVDVSLQSLRERHEALFIAIGAGAGRKLGIEGEESDLVIDALSFLQLARAARPPKLGSDVVVIGGGNAAIDAARTAKRLVGDKGRVTIVYRRTRDEMPADPEEMETALDEGISLMELASPRCIAAGEKRGCFALECSLMELGETDSDGRRLAVPIDGRETKIPATAIIAAIGQGSMERNLVESGLELAKDGRIKVDNRLETNLQKVFAGGDAVRGAASIVEAIADAKTFVESIDGLGGCGQTKETTRMTVAEREELMLAKSRRICGRPTSGSPLSNEQARDEARRCLSCDKLCALCVTVCPNRANVLFETDTKQYEIPIYTVRDGAPIRGNEKKTVELRQQWQTANIADLCNECGNCVTFCPTAGSPFSDKIRICLGEEAAKEIKEGVVLLRRGESWTIEDRSASEIAIIFLETGFQVQLHDIFIELRSDFSVGASRVTSIERAEGKEIDLTYAVELILLSKGLITSFLCSLTTR